MREVLRDAGVAIAGYIRPRSTLENPRSAEWTLNRLIELLDNQKVAEAVYSHIDDAGGAPDTFRPDQRSQEQVLPEG